MHTQHKMFAGVYYQDNEQLFKQYLGTLCSPVSVSSEIIFSRWTKNDKKVFFSCENTTKNK